MSTVKIHVMTAASVNTQAHSHLIVVLCTIAVYWEYIMASISGDESVAEEIGNCLNLEKILFVKNTFKYRRNPRL